MKIGYNQMAAKRGLGSCLYARTLLGLVGYEGCRGGVEGGGGLGGGGWGDAVQIFQLQWLQNRLIL